MNSRAHRPLAQLPILAVAVSCLYGCGGDARDAESADGAGGAAGAGVGGETAQGRGGGSSEGGHRATSYGGSRASSDGTSPTGGTAGRESGTGHAGDGAGGVAQPGTGGAGGRSGTAGMGASAGHAGESTFSLGGASADACPALSTLGGGGTIVEGQVLVAAVFEPAMNYSAPRIVVDRQNRAVAMVPKAGVEGTDIKPPLLRWYSPFEGQIAEREYPKGAIADALGIDGDDSLWLGITNSASVSFGKDTISGKLPGYIVQKLSSTGEPLTGFFHSVDNGVLIYDIVPDRTGGVFVVASDMVVNHETSMANDRLLLVHHAADGSEIFQTILGSDAGAVMPRDAKLLPDGRLVVAGYFDDTVAFGGKTLRTLAWEGVTPYMNGWVAVFDPDSGVVESVYQLEATKSSEILGLGVGADGGLVVAGGLWGEAGLGALKDDYAVKHAFVAKTDTAGSPTFLEALAEPSVATAADVTQDGRTFVAGSVTENYGTPDAVTRAFLLTANPDGELSELWRSPSANLSPAVVVPDRCGGAWIGGQLGPSAAELGLGVKWPGGLGEFLIYVAARAETQSSVSP